MARQREQLFASAERGRPEVGHETWHQIDVRAGGEAYRLRVAQTRGNRYRVELEGVAGGRHAERDRPVRARGSPSAGTTYAVLVGAAGPGLPRGGRRRRAPDLRRRGRAGPRTRAGDGRGACRSRRATPSRPATTVAVVESMKLETALRAPFAGRVREVLVAGQHAGGGRHEAAAPGAGRRRAPPEESPQRAGRPGRAGRAAATAATRTSPSAAAADALAALRSLVLGYDVDEADARAAAARAVRGPRRTARRRPGRARRRARDHADLRRPLGAVAQPAWLGGRGDPAERRPRGRQRRAGAQPAGVPATPSCAPATPTPRGCPSRSGPRCAPRSPTTASATWARRTTMR